MSPDEIDETTGTRAYHDAESRVHTAEVALVHSERVLHRHRAALNSLREIWDENHFGSDLRTLMKSPVRGGA